MARLKQGILSGFSGRVGKVVGSSWKGKDIMRALPTSVTDPNSKGQKSQRTKFGIAGKFVFANLDAVKMGFKSHSKGMSAANAAMAYNLSNAIQGEFPEHELDFSKVQLSRGPLTPPTGAGAVAGENSTLTINWSSTGVLGKPTDNDMLMVSLYNPVTAYAAWYEACATRADESVTLITPPEWAGQNIEVFCFFVSALPASELRPAERTSYTVYCGNVLLT